MNTIETEFLSQIAKKYKLNVDKLGKNVNLQSIANKYTIPIEELTNLWNTVENELENYKEYDESIEYDIPQFGFNEQQHTFNENEISLKKFGLVDIPMENIYNMRKLKLIEGETKFFLRQLINTYNFLKYHEKLNITPFQFNVVHKNLTNITFPIKKSPLGLLLAIYIYDKNNILDVNKFYQILKIKQGSPIEANQIIPINYIYKVYASDIIRYVKMFHNIL